MGGEHTLHVEARALGLTEGVHVCVVLSNGWDEELAAEDQQVGRLLSRFARVFAYSTFPHSASRFTHLLPRAGGQAGCVVESWR